MAQEPLALPRQRRNYAHALSLVLLFMPVLLGIFLGLSGITAIEFADCSGAMRIVCDEYTGRLNDAVSISALALLLIGGWAFVILGSRSLAGPHNKDVQKSRDDFADALLERLRAGEEVPAFSLYLRPFITDGETRQITTLQGSVLDYASYFLEGAGRFDIDRTVADTLQDRAPLVCLGDRDGRLGAGKAATTGEIWKQDARLLMEKAERIIVVPLAQPSTQWELETLGENADYLRKTVFIRPRNTKLTGTFKPEPGIRKLSGMWRWTRERISQALPGFPRFGGGERLITIDNNTDARDAVGDNITGSLQYSNLYGMLARGKRYRFLAIMPVLLLLLYFLTRLISRLASSGSGAFLQQYLERQYISVEKPLIEYFQLPHLFSTLSGINFAFEALAIVALLYFAFHKSLPARLVTRTAIIMAVALLAGLLRGPLIHISALETALNTHANNPERGPVPEIVEQTAFLTEGYYLEVLNFLNAATSNALIFLVFWPLLFGLKVSLRYLTAYAALAALCVSAGSYILDLIDLSPAAGSDNNMLLIRNYAIYALLGSISTAIFLTLAYHAWTGRLGGWLRILAGTLITAACSFASMVGHMRFQYKIVEDKYFIDNILYDIEQKTSLVLAIDANLVIIFGFSLMTVSGYFLASLLLNSDPAVRQAIFWQPPIKRQALPL